MKREKTEMEWGEGTNARRKWRLAKKWIHNGEDRSKRAAVFESGDSAVLKNCASESPSEGTSLKLNGQKLTSSRVESSLPSARTAIGGVDRCHS